MSHPVISEKMRHPANVFSGSHLRNRNFAGYKFRRQHPIDPYILDFYSPSLKLAIELDGSGHAYSLREKRDQRRDEFLARQGIAVVRFWNHQIRKELDSVLQAIWFAIEKRSPSNPSLNPLPLRRERRLPSRSGYRVPIRHQRASGMNSDQRSV